MYTHYPSWGSETAEPWAHVRESVVLITPHGDRKRQTLGKRFGCYRGLITPHGDRKPYGHPACTLYTRVSLPLMGIGNWDVLVPGDDGTPALITPHGDRKHGWQRPVERRGSELITPHGDRKRPTGFAMRMRPTSSLPLMGIGNPTNRLFPSSLAGTHYPSWGSETRPSGPAHCAGPSAHYPSWGSETRAASGDRRAPIGTHYPSWGSETSIVERIDTCRPLASLPLMGIGNLQGAGPGRATRPSFSLPLMGIGNPAYACRSCAGRQRLITPHGDRKHAELEYATFQARKCSLPLMGIGNPARTRRRRSTPRSPHYPSWGSETGVLEGPAGGAGVNSLPLMGIGNCSSTSASGRSPCTHYPSWGSETQIDSARVQPGVRLITPHGDRKPRR